MRLKDVSRIELGGENYNFDTKYNGQPTAGFGIQLATGANALNTAKLVRAKIDDLSKYFPHGPRREVSVRHHAVREAVY